MAQSPLQQQSFPRSQTALPGTVTDVDNPNSHPEDTLSLPWVFDAALTWLDYRCWVEVELDAGMVLHKQLPQGATSVDTLASAVILRQTSTAPRRGQEQTIASQALANNAINTSTQGVNIVSASQSADIIQRMATSTYRFRLRGHGLRAGYQIPIPGLLSIGGLPAIPERMQRAYNAIVGNLLGGIPLWQAVWDLQYIMGSCPQEGATAPVPSNLAANIGANARLPRVVLLPQTPVDQRSTQQTRAAPTVGRPFIQTTR